MLGLEEIERLGQDSVTLVRRVPDILTMKAGVCPFSGDPLGDTPLHYACRHNMPLRLIQLFIKLRPQAASMCNANVETPLTLACCCSSPTVPNEAVELELDTFPESIIKVADDNDGYLPLHSACNCSSMPVITLLATNYP
jgi:ankyrin repeat protein